MNNWFCLLSLQWYGRMYTAYSLSTKVNFKLPFVHNLFISPNNSLFPISYWVLFLFSLQHICICICTKTIWYFSKEYVFELVGDKLIKPYTHKVFDLILKNISCPRAQYNCHMTNAKYIIWARFTTQNHNILCWYQTKWKHICAKPVSGMLMEHDVNAWLTWLYGLFMVSTILAWSYWRNQS